MAIRKSILLYFYKKRGFQRSPLRLLCALCVNGLILISPVNAQENSQEKSPDPVCQIMERHVPTNDVAYQAGIDAYGNAVVPADLNPSAPSYLPDVIKIPLNIDLAQRMASLPNGTQMDAPLGMLEIHGNGRVHYNGQDMTVPVMTLCGQSHEIKQEAIILDTPVLQENEQGDRLVPQDVIKSETVEVQPKQAVPPQDVTINQLEIEPLINDDNDIIQGGDYREIYYND